MQRAQQMEMDDYDDEPRPSIAEDPEYDNAATLRDRKRQAKEEKYARGPGTIAVPEEDVSGKREIGHTIMNNRGLTPHRSKGSTAYGGELTGVKTSVVKSRKF
jgi:U3 small nucleolar RNA-associated protein 3